MSLFKQTLTHLLDDAKIYCAENTADRCEEYFQLVKQANKHTNLTRIVDETEAAMMHFFSAIALLSFFNLPQNCRVIDIGTGAGFPGIPIKLARPDVELTLLDSAGKKTDFIRNAAQQMDLDVTVLNERAEETAKTALRENFDVVISRAVAALPMLCELCLPFVKPDGMFATWKGEQYKSELSDARNAIHILGGAVNTVHPMNLGAILLLKKQKPTPAKYPRRFSKIKNQPL